LVPANLGWNRFWVLLVSDGEARSLLIMAFLGIVMSEVEGVLRGGDGVVTRVMGFSRWACLGDGYVVIEV
jgi:hypothetical protein